MKNTEALEYSTNTGVGKEQDLVRRDQAEKNKESDLTEATWESR